MANFLTCNQWNARRITGAVLAVISIFLHADQLSNLLASGGNGLGYLLGMIVWGYILFLLLKAPDEPKTWKGIPHALLAILLYIFAVFVAALSYGNGQDFSVNKASRADDCIERKLKENADMNIATEECMREAGMSEDEQKALLLRTLDEADAMTVQKRKEWCLEFLPHFWEDPSTLDAACQYAAENWSEFKNELLQQIDNE